MPEPTPAGRPDGGRGNGLDLKLPFGQLVASGRDVVLILVLLGGFAGLGYVMHTGFTAILATDGRNQAEHLAITTSNQALICTLSLPTEVREAAVRSGDVCRYLMLRGTEGPR